MKPWQVRVTGVIVLVALLLLLRGYGPWETLIWFALLAVVLCAPIPQRFQKKARLGHESADRHRVIE